MSTKSALRKRNGRFAPKPQAQPELPVQPTESLKIRLVRELDSLESEVRELRTQLLSIETEVQTERTCLAEFEQQAKARYRSAERELNRKLTEINNTRVALEDALN